MYLSSEALPTAANMLVGLRRWFRVETPDGVASIASIVCWSIRPRGAAHANDSRRTSPSVSMATERAPLVGGGGGVGTPGNVTAQTRVCGFLRCMAWYLLDSQIGFAQAHGRPGEPLRDGPTPQRRKGDLK